METLEVIPQAKMLNLISGFWIARSIDLAAKLGIADVFGDQPQTIAQLAAATNTNPRSLYRLMRALASVGIFTEVSNQCFTLTPLGATLRSDSPDSMRYFALAQMGYDHSLGWSHGVHSLEIGEAAFDAVTGMSVWDYYAQHPEEGQIFSQSMTNAGTESAQAVVASYNFSELNTIADVGGAQGSLISAIVQSYPHLKGVLFDLPEVIANVSVNDKIQPVAGNFFESVPLVVQKSLESLMYRESHDETEVTEKGMTWDAQVSTQKDTPYVYPPTLSSTANSIASMDLPQRPATSARIL